MALEAHWRRINRALDQINALDKSIKTWLCGDAYRIVKEHDANTRRTAYVARIDSIPDDWADLIGEAVHSMRSALDRVAFALNAKGYAGTHGGAVLPAEREADSTFPIFGNVSQRGVSMDGERAFESSTSHRLMPPGAVTVIEGLQPYKRGQEFRHNPLWALHELGRIDRHRLDIAVAAATPLQTIDHLHLPAVDHAVIGIGGPVHNGKELSYWVTTEGYPEPEGEIKFTRDVLFGQAAPVPLPNTEIVPTLRMIREHIRFKVLFPLKRYL